MWTGSDGVNTPPVISAIRMAAPNVNILDSIVLDGNIFWTGGRIFGNNAIFTLCWQKKIVRHCGGLPTRWCQHNFAPGGWFSVWCARIRCNDWIQPQPTMRGRNGGLTRHPRLPEPVHNISDEHREKEQNHNSAVYSCNQPEVVCNWNPRSTWKGYVVKHGRRHFCPIQPRFVGNFFHKVTFVTNARQDKECVCKQQHLPF